MNLLVFKMKNLNQNILKVFTTNTNEPLLPKQFQKYVLTLLFFALLANGCKKEEQYVYDVNPVTVEQEGGIKQHPKTNTEFISIAYSDLFGTTISNADLQKLNVAYSAFGDRKLIEDMIVKNFLNDASIAIPSKAQMQNDVPKFVTDTYKKLYNRLPNEYEKYYVIKVINADATITPSLVYYAMMTSNEYRYY
jgi:hypothetical protein